MFAHNIDLYSKDTGNSYEAPIYSMKVCGIFGEIDVWYDVKEAICVFWSAIRGK